MKKTLYIFVLTIFVQVAFAQQNNSMYFMQTVAQSKGLNPAIEHNSKIHISGLLIPLSGQLLPPVHLNYGSNALSVDHILQYNSELDSLVLPGYKGFDNQRLLDALKKSNVINFEMHFNLLSIGWKHDDWCFGIDVNQKINTHVAVSEDLVKFALDGNAGEQFFGKTANIGDFGLDFTAYTEYGFSVSKQINDKLRVGATAKLLMGQANVWAEKTKLEIHTSDRENYPMTVKADMLVHSSQPIVEIREVYYDTVGDSLVVDTTSNDFNPIKSYFNTNNLGLGLDLGATYKLNNQVELYASITDLGYIRWKDNANSLTINGECYWDGYDFQPDLTKDDNLVTEHRDSIRNEIIESFNPNSSLESYTTSLGPKIYLGGTYKITDKIKTGVLLRGMFYRKHFNPSLMLSGNFQLTKWFEAVASYSVINGTFNNVGLGFALRMGVFQFFAVSDNVVGAFLPQSTRNVNLRMGVNLAFGRSKEKADKDL